MPDEKLNSIVHAIYLESHFEHSVSQPTALLQ